LCLAEATPYAGGVVVQKPLLERISGPQVTSFACLVAAACPPFRPGARGRARRGVRGGDRVTLYLGIAPTAIGFTTWASALKRTSANRMGATTYLVSPLAVLMGWAILGETPPALALLRGALCRAGVAVTREGRLLRCRRLPRAAESAAGAH
jgi:drug/metabolite transporter (DMT)-like permease